MHSQKNGHHLSGTPGRIRTYDKKIKSLLLYQLSYGGVVLAG